jgi:hypothetical protein
MQLLLTERAIVSESATQIILPPGVRDSRPETYERCPNCEAPKEFLAGSNRRRFPVIKNKLVCMRCGEEVRLDG